MLGTRIDADLERKLIAYARKTCQSKSRVVKSALREYLRTRAVSEEHDRKTLEGWRQIENEEGIPASEIEAYLKTWGSAEEI